MSDSEVSEPLSEVVTWINTFCSLLGHEYFAQVSEDFIEDDFNLTGLQSQVPMYKDALEMLLDVDPDSDLDYISRSSEEDDDDEDAMRDEDGRRIDNYGNRLPRTRSDMSVIESSAELLYGLIHQRFITSRPGIQQMAEKYEAQHFGHCPRVFCNSAKVLPVGIYDTPGIDTVKLFCPSCLDVYTPPNSRFQSVDGAFFGTTFGCLFFMTFPEFNITPQGDPLNLASTNPIFSTSGLVALRETTTLARRDSRSSSLTSATTPQVSSSSQIPPEWLPPANQPPTMNGIYSHNTAPGLGPGRIHEPRIYGFKVSERAKTGPRMRWLRSRPVDVTELDEIGRANRDADEDMDDPDSSTRQVRNGTRVSGNSGRTATTKRKKSLAGGSSSGAKGNAAKRSTVVGGTTAEAIVEEL